ncbi:MAG: hypothetical protein NTX63_01260 [Candidatus Peregrinibacteria bacterium]|nr:hypothetical protein [Candidatus Peregrinibacteria bacterium]
MRASTNQPSGPFDPHTTTEILIGHYRLHGYPQGVTEGDVSGDVRDFVHGRIMRLTEVDPFYLSDAKRVELRIVGGMANQLGIQSKTAPEDVPLTDEESMFLKDIGQNPLPENIEAFEEYLGKHNLPAKEILSLRVRMRVMRAIISHYMSDAETFFRALTSPIVQNMLSGDEYRFMEKYVSPEMRVQLLGHFKANNDRNNLPQEVGMMLMRYAIQSEDERSAIMLFEAYPNVYTVNTILKIPGEKRDAFIIKMISRFVPQLSLEENSKVNWKVVFEKITEPSEYFVPLANRIPQDLEVADAWGAIIDATIAQRSEKYIQWLRSIVPSYGLPNAAFTKLMQAAHIE